MTQKEIAKNTGFTPRHINRVFRHKQKPSVKLAKRLQELLGIPWTSWFEETPVASEKETV